MAELHESMVTLRVFGNTLIPSEITQLLGCEPTAEQTKGQVFKNKRSGKERIANTGMWRLNAIITQPADLDSQISEILNKLNQDITTWKQISQKYDLDLACGFFMEKTNESVLVSPESINELGERGIGLNVDIYASLDVDDD